MKAIVIGAGLFGSVIAAELRRHDCEVTVIDGHYMDSGSKPAACLMKPSWFQGGMSKRESSIALATLDRLYGVHNLRFRVGPLATTVHYCDPKKILQPEDIQARVKRIAFRKGKYIVYKSFAATDSEQSAEMVIVAAGVWSAGLAEVEGGVTGLGGFSYLWPGETIAEPFIRPWAPYKQLVAFDRGDGLWVGDGTALKPENIKAEHFDRSYERCSKAVGLDNGKHWRMFGIRPYTKYKPCYLKEQQPGLWVVTGGAKNGLISASWAANEICRKVFR